jgi:hypothetical protein
MSIIVNDEGNTSVKYGTGVVLRLYAPAENTSNSMAYWNGKGAIFVESIYDREAEGVTLLGRTDADTARKVYEILLQRLSCPAPNVIIRVADLVKIAGGRTEEKSCEQDQD